MNRVMLGVMLAVGATLIAGCDQPSQVLDPSKSPNFSFTQTPGSGQWTSKASMSSPRNAFGAVVINDNLYAFGGGNHIDGTLASVEAYNPASDTWVPRASMLVARYGFGAAALNGQIFVVGGCCDNGGLLATVEAYDPSTDTWTQRASMSTARYFLGLAAANGKLYAVGGYGNDGFLSAVEEYDPTSDTWTTRASMPTARYGLGVATVTGIVYAVGGGNQTGVLGTTEAYDPVTDTWTTFSPMPTARLGLGAVAVNGLLYAVGGGNGSTDLNAATDLATVESLDPLQNAWTVQPSMPTSRKLLGVADLNGILYALGGRPLGDFNELATVEDYAPDCTLSPSGLVNWWPGEGSAADVVGGNAGTMESGAGFRSGLVSQAFQFDGIDDYVDLGTSGSLEFGSSDFTFEFWARWNSLAGEQVMIEKFDNGPAFGGVAWTGWTLTKMASNQLQFGGSSGGAYLSVDVTSPGIGTGEWHHVAVTRSAGVASIYWDGASIGTLYLPSIDPTSQSLKLGRRGDGRGFFHNGLIDEVSIYNRALSAAEIRTIYTTGAGGKCPPPVAAVGGPYTGAEAASISFDGSGSTSPSGLGLTYAWDFGDGATATGMAVSHTYADNGTYTVTLTVSDGHLANSAATVANVFNVAPTATFNRPGTTKEGSKFTISLSNPLDPSPVDQAAGFTYAFDCGSGYGAFATSISVSCPTADNGVIPIRAKLRDKDGGVREYTATQTVTNVAPNVTLNAASSQKIRVGDSFTVTGSFTDVGVQDAPWTVIIDWGNGTTTTTASVQGSPIGQSRVYTVGGTYQVRMRVTDKDGGTGTSSSVTVKVQ